MESRRIIQQQAAPLRNQVVEVLRQEILDDVLHPGQRLKETDLCDRYGVSRTVIREALRQLESESLITMLPNIGPIVTVLSVHDIESLYEIRERLEGLAGELFAKRATPEQAHRLIDHVSHMETSYLRGDVESRAIAKNVFYRILLEGSGNSILEASLRSIHTRIGIFKHYAFLDEKRVAVSMEEILRIVDAAARKRDPERARVACEEHIRLAGKLAVVEYKSRVEELPSTN